MTAVSLEETLDGVQVEIAGMGGLSIKHLLIGFGGEAPDGRLHAWLDIGLDELDSPSLPPQGRGLPAAALRDQAEPVRREDCRSAQAGAGRDEEGADSDARNRRSPRCFSHGGVNVGLETLSFDLGPAKVRAPATSPHVARQWHGEAHVIGDRVRRPHDAGTQQSRSAAGAAGPDHAARDGQAGWRSAGVGHRERRSEADGERSRPVDS